jgi:hypothetical protein
VERDGATLSSAPSLSPPIGVGAEPNRGPLPDRKNTCKLAFLDRSVAGHHKTKRITALPQSRCARSRLRVGQRAIVSSRMRLAVK